MANLRTITNFKSALRGGGARPNLFEVDITGWPGSENMGDFGNDAKEEFQFLCKAAALPASNITPIEIPFRGRTLKVAGDRTFDTWNITIINDDSPSPSQPPTLTLSLVSDSVSPTDYPSSYS